VGAVLLRFSSYWWRYPEGLADGAHFLLVLSAFLGDGLAVPDLGDELVESDHSNNSYQSIYLLIISDASF
jgi:hypothetical protein